MNCWRREDENYCRYHLLQSRLHWKISDIDDQLNYRIFAYHLTHFHFTDFSPPTFSNTWEMAGGNRGFLTANFQPGHYYAFFFLLCKDSHFLSDDVTAIFSPPAVSQGTITLYASSISLFKSSHFSTGDATINFAPPILSHALITLYASLISPCNASHFSNDDATTDLSPPASSHRLITK